MALRAAVLMVVGTALLTLSAKMQVPFYPVPMTMQTLVVLLSTTADGRHLDRTKPATGYPRQARLWRFSVKKE